MGEGLSKNDEARVDKVERESGASISDLALIALAAYSTANLNEVGAQSLSGGFNGDELWWHVDEYTQNLNLDFPGTEYPLFENDGIHLTIYTDREGNYVFAWEGSEDIIDWVNNVNAGLGFASEQQEMVRRIAEKYANKYSEANITHVGHSQGGMYATVAAIETGHNFVTFNPQGIPDNKPENHLKTGTAFIVRDEILNAIQDTYVAGSLWEGFGENDPVTTGAGYQILLDPAPIDQSIDLSVWNIAGTLGISIPYKLTYMARNHGMTPMIRAINSSIPKEKN